MQAVRQAARHADRQAARHAVRQASRKAVRQIGRQVGRQADRQAGRQTFSQAGMQSGRHAVMQSGSNAEQADRKTGIEKEGHSSGVILRSIEIQQQRLYPGSPVSQSTLELSTRVVEEGDRRSKYKNTTLIDTVHLASLDPGMCVLCTII